MLQEKKKRNNLCLVESEFVDILKKDIKFVVKSTKYLFNIL